MASKKSKKRLFSGMGYREVQRSNSSRRSRLPKQQQRWLKDNGYRNIGWDNVIKLYQKINDLLASIDDNEPTLEDLFLRADRIGQKYQSAAEITAFNQAMNSEVESLAEQIDQQFSDDEFEHVDYSESAPRATRKRHRR